jgi:LmbE family N-acetylglucosaminyl deacetylase
MCLRLQPAARTVLIAAHPDDEVIGASTLIPQLSNLTIVHATDGAPENLKDAREHGFDCCEAYSRARREELLAALQAAGAADVRLVELGVKDQKSAYHLVDLTARLLPLIEEADQVLTHPYEGGHPDHDACAFAARAALQNSASKAKLVEFTSYHASSKGMEASECLGDVSDVMTVELSEEERERKRQACACFKTQTKTLQYFPIAVERFRPAPAYDFTHPPHEGRLFYENYDWGMTSGSFCKLASEAIRELRL